MGFILKRQRPGHYTLTHPDTTKVGYINRSNFGVWHVDIKPYQHVGIYETLAMATHHCKKELL